MTTASAERGDQSTGLRRRLERAKAENEILERMIEDTTRSLYGANQELQERKQQLETLLTGLSAAVIATDGSGIAISVEGRTTELTGRSRQDLVGRPLSECLQVDDEAAWSAGGSMSCEGSLLGADGRSIPVVVSRSALADAPDAGAVYTAIDVSERKRLELELRHAQRLEAIGSLAAGVAHELNTPIQYVIDSVRFIADSVEDLLAVDEQHRALRELARGFDGGSDLVDAIEREEASRDLEFSREEIPGAIDRAVGGLQRMSKIIKAMRRFSHPGEDVILADVNQVVETAITLAAHEYKYVADLEVELGELPEVPCNKVDLSGVIVNLLVNASYAIGERMAESEGRGQIRITTEVDGEGVRIDLADNGGGIPAEIQERVFEHFFTTKAPGQGTGQGLALAYETIVTRHGGRLTFDVVDGEGTTFHIWLPAKGTA